VCIPVNWTTKRNGEAVMGAGVAKQAAERWPWLPRHLGRHIRCQPQEPRLFLDRTASLDENGPELLGLATKRDWRDPADMGLIEAGVNALAIVTNACGWRTVALPRLGCGLGGLRWEDVKPILACYLDDRFVVVSQALDTPAANGRQAATAGEGAR
jgi:O-acetyl-ADP-ribose deacetylase (regulator of RNase III)